MCFGIEGGSGARPDSGRKPELCLPRNRSSDLALYTQNLAQFAIVFFRPQVRLVDNLNQLCRDSHAVAGTPHSTFQDVVNLQLSADLINCLGCSFVAHGRGTRDHP